MPSGATVLWEAPAAGGAVRVTQDGVWVLSSFHDWNDVAYGRLAADGRTVEVHLTDETRLAAGFGSAADATELLRYFRQHLYPHQPCTIHVVINPLAGQGQADAVYDTRVRPSFEASPHTTVVYHTQGRGHAGYLVQHMVLAPGDVIVCVSGTGVLNEVVNAVVGHAASLPHDLTVAMVPVGSSNGVAVSLGILSPVHAAKVVTSKQRTLIDVIRSQPVTLPRPQGQVSGTLGSGGSLNSDEALVQVHASASSDSSSVTVSPRQSSDPVAETHGSRHVRYGILAYTAAIAAEVSWRSEAYRALGRWRYALPALRRIFARPEYYLSFNTPDDPEPQPPSSLVTYFIATSLPHLYDGCHAAPSARADDGLLHVQWIPGGHANRRNLLRLYRRLATGAHLTSAGTPVQSITTREITIDVEDTQLTALDGELLPSTPCRLTVLPSCLQISVPCARRSAG
eukprot:TRINITY_DN22619_c0_g1_i1.p1 TRINITY_DN22619_c0_g1~~TRINITY_DN22619_c0_g1_i1.p1  ORF type:complete len:500 (+),score=121.57 TRINITY_DN22619_c0_g1_i1:136-1500(+)